MRKLTIEFVRESFKKEGYELLSDEYTNGKKLLYRCPNNHEHTIIWGNWQQGNRCVYCSNRPPITIDKVRLSFEKYDYTLLTDIYENCSKKLSYICRNGHRHSISYNNWKIGNRCPYCAGLNRKSIEEVRSSFESEGYILLTNEYINCNQKLHSVCSNGHDYFVTWDNWNHRNSRCKTCADIKNSGENHPNWKGGISFEPYCEVWKDKEYKFDIMERDNNMCLNPYCFHISDSLLSIHHIDYTKTICGPDNLITLCRSCNSRANKDREWHTEWYRTLLNKRYGYVY